MVLISVGIIIDYQSISNYEIGLCLQWGGRCLCSGTAASCSSNMYCVGGVRFGFWGDEQAGLC